MQQRRRRSVHLHVMATPGEQTKIRERMTQTDILNMGVCMRKIALNSYVLQAALSPICWRSRPRWWTCDPWERPGPLPGCLRLRTLYPEASGGFGVQSQQAFSRSKNPKRSYTCPACHVYQKFPITVVIGKLFLSEILTEMPYLKGFSAKIFR